MINGDTRWLWTGRLPEGGLAVIRGDKAVGKSFLAEAIAAAVSRGRDWPDGAGKAPIGDTLIMSPFDSDGWIAARLRAMDADLHRVSLVESYRGEGPSRIDTDIKDIPFWDACLDHHPECRLLILDPLYMACSAKTPGEIQDMLGRFLEQIVEPRGICLITTEYLRRVVRSRSPHCRIPGPAWHSTLARVVHVISEDCTNKDIRYFGVSADDRNPDPPPHVAFRIVTRQKPKPGMVGIGSVEFLPDATPPRRVLYTRSWEQWLRFIG